MNEPLERLLSLVRQHEVYRVRSCINLRANENYTSPQLRNVLSSDLAHRTTSPDPMFIYRGTRYMNEVRDLTMDLGRQLFRADYINVWAPTGHAANIVTFFAFCRPGDKVLVLAPNHGGYGGIAAEGLPECLGLQILYFPFDPVRLTIDVDRAVELIERERPALIVFGATYCPFPQPVRELTPVAKRHGIPIAYDGAHVMGLIAGGQFQDPLREGADVLFGSTMKSLGGPPGGVLLTNDRTIYDKLNAATWYRGVTATQWNRVAALGVRFAELLAGGADYAAQVVSNGRNLAGALHERGVGVMSPEQNFTASHMFLLDVGGLDKNVSAQAGPLAAKLEEANIIIDDRGRVGLSEVTRLGMKEGEMVEIADLMAGVLLGGIEPEAARRAVRATRNRFSLGLEAAT